MTQAEIEKMSVSERLQTIELLWQSISVGETQFPSPEWHQEVLEQRLARVERGEAEFLTLDEVKARLARKEK